MKYCSRCGHPVTQKIPPDDNRPRYVCETCGTIHYQNPRLIVGCVPEWNGQILLCRRAIEPRYGYWTLPAGFMENSETTAEGAARETWEEAQTKVRILEPLAMINIARINQVHLFYRAEMLSKGYAAGIESLEVALIDMADVPWEQLAFPSVRFTLESYIADRQAGDDFQFRTKDIIESIV